MTTVTKSTDFRRSFGAAAGAFVLSAALLGAAVSPGVANAADRDLTKAQWSTAVADRLNNNLREVPDIGPALRDNIAIVAVHFDATGEFAGAWLEQRTGSVPLDREALHAARAFRYPALPADLRGKPRTMTISLSFGDAAHARNKSEIPATMERIAAQYGAHDVQVAAQ